MNKRQLWKTGAHLIPAILTIALILGCASRPEMDEIPDKLDPVEREAVLEEEKMELETGEGDFDDGVYEGSAEGYGGPVKVKVTVEDRQITDIEILDASKETDSFFQRAKAVVEEILRLQSWEVDVVSGATYSSNGIRGAVENALTGKEIKTEKAAKTSSGNSSALKKVSYTTPSGGYKDGTYTGSAQGFGGTIGVSVTVSGGKITAVNVTSASGETASYLSSAKGVISRILSKQTPNVDTVSGATYSSNGILNAVKEALNKAAGTGSNAGKTNPSGSSAARPNYHYKDGTYTGVGEGYGGEIQVTVTVQNGQITNVNLDSAPEETPAYLNRARSLLTSIKEKQKWDLDAVSGATYSSEGILEAVENAMTSSSESSEKKEDTPTASYQDGVYYGTGTGYDHVKLRAKVTIENGKIAAIEILEADTESTLYQKSASGVVEEIRKEQRWDVDSIVGATYSSNGIKEAVSDALAQAEKGSGSEKGTVSVSEENTTKVTVTATVHPDAEEDFEPYEITLTLTIQTENGRKTVLASELSSDTNKTNRRYLDKAFDGMRSGLTNSGRADAVTSATCSSKAIQNAWTAALNK